MPVCKGILGVPHFIHDDETGQDGVNGERGLMLAELNHRSKNIMQSVAASLSLMASRSKSGEAREVLKGAAARMRAMAEAYAILYRGMGEVVPVRAYLQRLCAALLQMADGREISIRVSGANPTWPEEVASDIGMIVSEAVLNSLKHGFAAGGAGVIEVGLHEGPSGWVLTVQDDGDGYDSGGARRGLGTDLVEAFAHHLSGTAEWVSAPGDGTQLRVSFPAPGAA